MLPGTLFGTSNPVLFFSLAYRAALSPFLVFAGYVLRTTIVAEQAVSADGFIVE